MHLICAANYRTMFIHQQLVARKKI